MEKGNGEFQAKFTKVVVVEVEWMREYFFCLISR